MFGRRPAYGANPVTPTRVGEGPVSTDCVEKVIGHSKVTRCKQYYFLSLFSRVPLLQEGTTRRINRECLDHVVVLGERHLRHLLANYATYYNGVRTHLALDKDSPLHRPAQTVGRISSVTWLGGLDRYYVRTA